MTTPQTGFNLVDDPWIELGDSVVSIREALVRGDELPGWPSGEPLFASVLIRLLLPIVYRTTGMDTAGLTGRQFASRQRRLLADGRLDRDAVNGYLNCHRDRFWLTVPLWGSHRSPKTQHSPPSSLFPSQSSWPHGRPGTIRRSDPTLPVGDIHIASAARWLLIMHGYKSGGMHTARKPGKGPVSLRASVYERRCRSTRLARRSLTPSCITSSLPPMDTNSAPRSGRNPLRRTRPPRPARGPVFSNSSPGAMTRPCSCRPPRAGASPVSSSAKVLAEYKDWNIPTRTW